MTVAWFIEDESDAYTDGILRRVLKDKAIVPVVWVCEMANVLVVCKRRKRLTLAQSRWIFEQLQALPIEVDDIIKVETVSLFLSLARDHGLSAYDAAYLELAMRRGCPLATTDDKLSAVAQRCGIALATP